MREKEQNELIKSLNNIENMLGKTIDTFSSLLIDSEKRIERTNEMVMGMTKAISELTLFSKSLEETYIKHFDISVQSRKTAEEVSLNLSEALRKEQERCDKLIDKISDIARNSSDVIINHKG